jgi:putative DNA primase/helicase
MNKLSKELPGILNWAIQGCLEWQKQGLNPPQIILDQVKAYKTEMDSIAQFVDEECLLDVESKHPSSKLYDTYRHYCMDMGRKPQSSSSFKRALDKLHSVYQSRTSSGMYWHGIRPQITTIV